MPTPETIKQSEVAAARDAIFVEVVTDRIGDHVLGSTVRPATKNDVLKAQKLHEAGACSHSVITDQAGWPYDFRKCHTCGKGLGVV